MEGPRGRRIIEGPRDGDYIISPAGHGQIALAESWQEPFQAHTRRRDRQIEGPAIQIGHAMGFVDAVDITPGDRRDFDMVPRAVQAAIDRIIGHALDDAVRRIEGQVPLHGRTPDVTCRRNSAADRYGQPRRGDIQRDGCSRKGDIGNIIFRVKGTAGLEGAAGNRSIQAMDDGEAIGIVHIGYGRVDRSPHIGQALSFDVSLGRNLVIFRIAIGRRRTGDDTCDGDGYLRNHFEGNAVEGRRAAEIAALDATLARAIDMAAGNVDTEAVDGHVILMIDDMGGAIRQRQALVIKCTDGHIAIDAEVLHRPPGLAGEAGRTAHGQLIRKSRQIDRRRVDGHIEDRRIATDIDEARSFDVLAVNGSYRILDAYIISRNIGMAVHIRHVIALGRQTAIDHIGLTRYG